MYNDVIVHQAASLKLGSRLLAVSVLGDCVVAAKQSTGADKKSGAMTLSGCLQKENIRNRFRMIGQDNVSSLRSSANDFEGSEVNEEYGRARSEIQSAWR